MLMRFRHLIPLRSDTLILNRPPVESVVQRVAFSSGEAAMQGL
jgi:hypothetical protein